MTPSQEEHLEYIKIKFKILVDKKYRKGQKEHGGDLEDMGIFNLVDMALNEAIDQIVYLLTLREKLLGEEKILEESTDINNSSDIILRIPLERKFEVYEYLNHRIDNDKYLTIQNFLISQIKNRK